MPEENKFNKEIKVIKQTEQKLCSYRKSVVESIKGKPDQAEDRICELEESSFENIQSKKKNKLKWKERNKESLCNSWDTIKRCSKRNIK
jgi:hypothetical protein